MNEKSRLQNLGRAEIEALAEKALTAQERNRQASAKTRQAKKAAGLQQVSLWLPRNHPDIEKLKKHAERLCDKHLVACEAEANSPEKSIDSQGQNQTEKTSTDTTPKSSDGKEAQLEEPAASTPPSPQKDAGQGRQ